MADAERCLRQMLQDIARDREYFDNEIELKSLSTGGANYTSKLFTTTLSAPGKEDLHVFSKVATLGEKMRSMTSLSVFETEIMFYTRILPKYKEFEELYKIPVTERLIVPEYYGGSTERLKELVVIEDLSVKGYQSIHRHVCFDWDYASRSVGALARFHALSMALERRDPAAYSSMVDGLKFDYPADHNYLIKGLTTAVKATDEKYRGRVERFLQDDLEKGTFLKFWDPKHRRVLCHGDFRPSNILHKIDESGELNVVLVDYQIIRRGNPVADLVFFLICGSSEQFRDEYLHQFFDHYYHTFCAALRRLQIDPNEVYLQKDYWDDVQEMLSFGLTLGVYSLPLITVEVDAAPKPEDCIDVEDFDLEVGERFRERFNGLVSTYVKLGLL